MSLYHCGIYLNQRMHNDCAFDLATKCWGWFYVYVRAKYFAVINCGNSGLFFANPRCVQYPMDAQLQGLPYFAQLASVHGRLVSFLTYVNQ
jgi:hypothetical protein